MSADLDQVRDEWAEDLVHASAFRHVRAEPACTGYTMASSGRTTCWRCGWQLSGRLEDVGEVRSARFAYAALARVGEALHQALAVVAQALIAAVLPTRKPAQLLDGEARRTLGVSEC